jgi:ribonuclease HII
MKEPHFKIEKEHWAKDQLLAGVDEVGRGCLAGPVVAAAVVLPKDHKRIKNVRDSKTLNEKQRREIFDAIIDSALDFGVGLVPAGKIDLIGIHVASRLAMTQAVNQLNLPIGKVIVDGKFPIDDIIHEQEALVDGDALCYTVSCASILAKVFRDQVVAGFDNVYPDYGFSSHKGYATKKHYDAHRSFGITPEHRRTFLKKFEFKN